MKLTGAWFHSWYGDIIGLHLVPFIFIILALLGLPPFGSYNFSNAWEIVTWILVLDWAHIFAQWHRIYGNPAESSRMKWVYPVSYVLLIPVFALIILAGGKFHLETFLVYFVIFHFIKQQFGFIRVYSRIDSAKGKIESFNENTLIYLTMVTPLLAWHTFMPYDQFGWNTFLIKSPLIQNLVYPAAALYFFCGILYIYWEADRTFRTKTFNLGKNLALLSGALGWGLVSILAESKLLIFFTVVLAHDLSYIVLVWLIGRRDKKLSEGKIGLASWWSVPGFLGYLCCLVVVSQLILLIHHRFIGKDYPNLVFGNILRNFTDEYFISIGFAIYFATQAHHYFIDRYLWKKEKDYNFLVKAGKTSLPDTKS